MQVVRDREKNENVRHRAKVLVFVNRSKTALNLLPRLGPRATCGAPLLSCRV